MKSNPDCIFCKMVAGDAPASLIYRDDLLLGFMDIHPETKGHALVIPKSHAEGIEQLDPSLAGKLFEVMPKLCRAIRIATACEGINLLVADGEVAGQEVFHVHLHIIPRYSGDGFDFQHALGFPSSPERQNLDVMAHAIRNVLDQNAPSGA